MKYRELSTDRDFTRFLQSVSVHAVMREAKPPLTEPEVKYRKALRRRERSKIPKEILQLARESDWYTEAMQAKNKARQTNQSKEE